MGIARSAPAGSHYTFPISFSGRLACDIIAAWVGTVKIVEFMSTDGIPLLQQLDTGIGIYGKSNITEPPKLWCMVRFPLHHTAHFVFHFIHVLHAFMEIHKTTAFRKVRQAIFNSLTDLVAQFFVFFQCFRIQLRIASTQQEPADIFRKTGVTQRRKWNQFCPEHSQKLKVILVIKTKGLIHRHSDPRPDIPIHFAAAGCLRHLQVFFTKVFCFLCKRKQFFKINTFF